MGKSSGKGPTQRHNHCEQRVTVHVSLINILKAVPRVKILTRKFEEKPKNKKTRNATREVTKEVAGMVFKYKKK
jgi:hypothetical protein